MHQWLLGDFSASWEKVAVAGSFHPMVEKWTARSEISKTDLPNEAELKEE